MASTMPAGSFAKIVLSLLEETFPSPAREDGNTYLDRRTGWLPTLAAIDAELASRPVAPGATTIAGHVAHTRYYLDVNLAYARGSHPELDWPGSWNVTRVTPEGWTALVAGLEASAEDLSAFARATSDWTDDAIGCVLAGLTHSAYHLGAVRQMLRVLDT